jgi:hypothetical protein
MSGMDPTKQLYESQAHGWQRGLYADIKQALRAPIVNSIWRTQMFHAPQFLRYAWGQLKPVFETREFAAFTVAYRDTLLTAVESELPDYDPATVDLAPSAFTELQGQLATFDIVSPRLVVLFKLMDRRLNDRPVGTNAEVAGEAATAPFPEWLDRDRGLPPTMLPQDESRAAMPDTLAGNFDGMVPSIYRCLAQWPSYLEHAWDDLAPLLQSDAFETAREEALDLADTYLDRLAYTPQVDPATLTEMGFDESTVDELQDLFAMFTATGNDVVPILPVYAATVETAGDRDTLTFPEWNS